MTEPNFSLKVKPNRSEIKLEELGKALCALSKEFSLFMKQYYNVESKKCFLLCSEIEQGYLIVNYFIDVVLNTDVNVLLLFAMDIYENPFSKWKREFLKRMELIFTDSKGKEQHIDNSLANEIMSENGVYQKCISNVKLQNLKQVNGEYQGVIKDISDKKVVIKIPKNLLAKVEQKKSKKTFIVDVYAEFSGGKSLNYEVKQIYDSL